MKTLHLLQSMARMKTEAEVCDGMCGDDAVETLSQCIKQARIALQRDAALLAAAPALLSVARTYAQLIDRLLANWSDGDLAAAVNALEDFRDNEALDAIVRATRKENEI